MRCLERTPEEAVGVASSTEPWGEGRTYQLRALRHQAAGLTRAHRATHTAFRRETPGPLCHPRGAPVHLTHKGMEWER